MKSLSGLTSAELAIVANYFTAAVVKRNGCLEWIRYSNQGILYAKVSIGKTRLYQGSARRLGFFLRFNKDIMTKFRIGVKCGNARCVNVEHFILSPSGKPRGYIQNRGNMGKYVKKLDNFSVGEIKRLMSCGISQKDIGRILGVSQSTICREIRRANEP